MHKSPDAATAHRHPRQRIVAIMMRPSGGTGWQEDSSVLHKDQAEKRKMIW
jgi:hypothetical protein